MSDIEGATCDECGSVIGPAGCCADARNRADRITALEAALAQERAA